MRRIDHVHALLDLASILMDEEVNINAQMPPAAGDKARLLGQLVDSALARAEQLQASDYHV